MNGMYHANTVKAAGGSTHLWPDVGRSSSWWWTGRSVSYTRGCRGWRSRALPGPLPSEPTSWAGTSRSAPVTRSRSNLNEQGQISSGPILFIHTLLSRKKKCLKLDFLATRALVRLRMSDGCCWEPNSHWRQVFLVNLFFPEFICLIDFLSDLFIVKNLTVTQLGHSFASFFRTFYE